jgi:predicted lipid carrier protein YhbT
MTAPFSPVLLFGPAVEKLPIGLVQRIANALLRAVLRRHPDCLERMAEWSDRLVCIDPVDLPFIFLLRPDAAAPRLTVHRRSEHIEAAATIRGALEILIALAEGRADGDTLFFSRALLVEGDTEVSVALRNAIDGAGIDLITDVSAALGPLGRPFRSLARTTDHLGGRLRADLSTLRSAVLAPAMRATDAQARRIAALEEEVRALRRASARKTR